jgi:hypothetical protein
MEGERTTLLRTAFPAGEVAHPVITLPIAPKWPPALVMMLFSIKSLQPSNSTVSNPGPRQPKGPCRLVGCPETKMQLLIRLLAPDSSKSAHCPAEVADTWSITHPSLSTSQPSAVLADGLCIDLRLESLSTRALRSLSRLRGFLGGGMRQPEILLPVCRSHRSPFTPPLASGVLRRCDTFSRKSRATE